MHTHIGKAIRMSDILSENSLVFDSTIASSIGAPEGMEDLSSTLQQLTPVFDGIILNPGQIEHLAHASGGKNRAAPLVRIDWTNAYRGEDFCLPVSHVKRIPMSNAQDVTDLGGSAAVATLFMGYGDMFEAENIRSISHLIRESYSLSLPVFVDIRPIGDHVSESNYEDTIQLGVSFMMEAGADGLIIPLCNPETLELIGNWSTIPVLAYSEKLITKSELQSLTGHKIQGIVFGEAILNEADYENKIQHLK